MSFEEFDPKKPEEYAAEAKAAWGDTAAYREYEEKTQGRTGEEDRDLAGRMMEIFRDFGRIKDRDPSSGEAQALVKKLQDFILAHYYTCTKEILSGLGQAYAAGGEFTANIDAAGGQGTAAFAAEAIKVFCNPNGN